MRRLQILLLSIAACFAWAAAQAPSYWASKPKKLVGKMHASLANPSSSFSQLMVYYVSGYVDDDGVTRKYALELYMTDELAGRHGTSWYRTEPGRLLMRLDDDSIIDKTAVLAEEICGSKVQNSSVTTGRGPFGTIRSEITPHETVTYTSTRYVFEFTKTELEKISKKKVVKIRVSLLPEDFEASNKNAFIAPHTNSVNVSRNIKKMLQEVDKRLDKYQPGQDTFLEDF